MEDYVDEEYDERHNISSSLPVEKQWTFKDGVRTIDFVLVCEKTQIINSNDRSEKYLENFTTKRELYEQNLINEGLEIEYDTSDDEILNFVKIHASLEVLRRYSEILKLRMPMKEELCTINKKNKMNPILQATTFITHKIPVLDRETSFLDSACNCWNNVLKRNVYVDQTLFPDQKHRFTAVYSRDKEYLFDLHSPGFFTPAIRSRIVQFILDRTSFAESSLQEDDLSSKEKVFFNFGIERLIASEVYSAAYPLHDGDLRTPGSMRYLLHTEWASVSKWYRYQPVDQIRGYFGVKIGLYFAWLGFYTHMLFPAAVVGVACFICSWFTLKYYEPSQDICSNESNVKMCPLCDVFCDFWDLQETCFHSKVAFLFDNYTTVFFAVFMSFWATMFLEMWKRYSAEITHRWDLTGFDAQEESPRPQYLARLALLDKANLAQYKLNVITNSIEPRVPFWRIRFPATIFSFSIVLLLVALALAAVLGVVLYRMSVLAALSVYGDSVITSYAILFTTATAATINLICIFIFNWIYAWLSQYLTELEMNRTQSEYDDSLTLKMYLLQFVNYYASIFYIAFCKGKLVGFPSKYNRLFGYRQEECGPGGCLMELCIQLAIIMVGKQAFNTCLEMVFPLLTKWWKSRGIKKCSKRGKSKQWEKDYKLVEWGAQALFPEYLEMVLQYGFVTIFVAAFPLAPLFALINNVLEMRLDAKKLLTFHRRPVSQRVRDIGVWFHILDTISKLAVITNGFIIAFTSDFVPQLVYTLMVSPEHSLNGYLNNSLSFMDTQDLDVKKPINTTLKYCRYPDYREPPWAENQYNKTTMYWNVLAARLAFVVIFENVVVVVVLLVQWCVPDVPAKLTEQIRRETYITNEIIIAQEARAAATRRLGQSMVSLGQTTDKSKSVDLNEMPNFVNSYDQTFIDLSKYNKEEIKDAVLVHIHKAKSFGEINEVSV